MSREIYRTMLATSRDDRPALHPAFYQEPQPLDLRNAERARGLQVKHRIMQRAARATLADCRGADRLFSLFGLERHQ